MSAPEESHPSERWTLTPADHVLIAAKNRANRLGFAVLLLFFREHGRFTEGSSEIDRQMVCEVAQQIRSALGCSSNRALPSRAPPPLRTSVLARE